MLNHVSFADNSEWNDLLNAIRSGGGGDGGSPISIDSTQWQGLLDGIEKGDTTAVTTALGYINQVLGQIKTNLDAIGFDPVQWGNLITTCRSVNSVLAQIKTNLDNISINNTQWTNLVNALSSVGIEQDSTQFNSLINAIQSQQVTLNLSNINTDNTQNNSSFNNSNLTSILNVIYNTLFNTDTSIIRWEIVTTFQQFDVYLFKIGIIKFLWIDTAKNQINSGWQSGGVGNLPTGYESLLNPSLSVNKPLRNGTQMTVTVNSTGTFNINPSASITSGYQIRQSFIYI